MQIPNIVPENIRHSFCAAKWLMVTMHFGMGENHSCYHPPIHPWKEAEVISCPSCLHNTSHKIEQRKKMLIGERPKECSYCFNIEDIDDNAITDRKRFTNEVWAQERLLAILNTPPDEHVAPAYLELSFSNACNFACSYCSPGQSSRWEAEIIKNGSYPVSDPTVQKEYMHEMISEDNNPYIDAFWKWLPSVYKDLRFLRITGGEPLITKNFEKLLNYIVDNNNPNLIVVVNTNLCVPDENLELFFKKTTEMLNNDVIKGIEVYTSIDTWGTHAEYIRDGLNIERWQNTIYKVHNEFNVPIRIMVTFGVLSIFNFSEFIDVVVEMRARGVDVMFNCALLTNPTQFDIRILPDENDIYFQETNAYITQLGSKITNVEQETWKIVYEYWIHRKETMTKNERDCRIADLRKFIAEYDKRRNKDFYKIFNNVKVI